MDSIPVVALKRGIDISSSTTDVHALYMCAATAKGRAGTCQASTKIGVLQLSATHILFRMIALFAYDHHGGSGEQMQKSLSEHTSIRLYVFTRVYLLQNLMLT